MKRDPSTVRSILLTVEAIDCIDCFELFSIDTHSLDEVHVAYLLWKDGYAEAISSTEYDVSLTRLTMKGHDLLDAIRDEQIWSKTKEKVHSTVGTVSLEMLKTVAEGFTKGMFGL